MSSCGTDRCGETRKLDCQPEKLPLMCSDVAFPQSSPHSERGTNGRPLPVSERLGERMMCPLCKGLGEVPTYWEDGPIWQRCPKCYGQAVPAQKRPQTIAGNDVLISPRTRGAASCRVGANAPIM